MGYCTSFLMFYWHWHWHWQVPQPFYTAEGKLDRAPWSEMSVMWINHYCTRSVTEFLTKDVRGDAKFGARPLQARLGLHAGLGNGFRFAQSFGATFQFWAILRVFLG